MGDLDLLVTGPNAAAALVKGAAGRDLSGAAELVITMTPSKARGDAAAMVMEKWLLGFGSDKPLAPEATAWLARLDSESIQRVLEQQQWRWAEADAKSLMDFVSSLRPEQIPTHTYSILAQ